MNASYLFRLICLSLAAFFIVNLMAGAVMAWTSSVAIRFAGRIRAESAARFLFAMRIAPAALALLIVIFLCVPSYLWLEPVAGTEQISGICFAAALAALTLWVRSTIQSWRAVIKSRRYLETCRQVGEQTLLAGQTAFVVPAGPTTALAGLFHHVLLISRDVLDALSAEQIEAAVLHERAHSASRDNLKRLAMLLAPVIFPLRRLERAWRTYAEFAADDRAVAGDPHRSVALAEALVRVARMGESPRLSPLTTSLLGDDISSRVDRLLNDRVPDSCETDYSWSPIVIASALVAALLLRPSTFDLVHSALERLIH